MKRSPKDKRDMTYLEKSLNDYPEYAVPEQVLACMAYFDSKGVRRKCWGATFYNWCANAKTFAKRNGGSESSDEDKAKASEQETAEYLRREYEYAEKCRREREERARGRKTDTGENTSTKPRG